MQQSLIIKAIGIILIVFHNFMNWTNSIGNNEMQLDPERIFTLVNFIEKNPLKTIDAFLSYFGYFGVQMFIFISGYGLSKKFTEKNFNLAFPSYKKYIIGRLIKVYALILFGTSICFIFFVYNIEMYMRSVSLTLIGIRNLSYRSMFEGIGPWWYFVLAIQLYIIFPFIYYIVNRYGKKGFYILLLISYLLIYSVWPVAEYFNVPLFGNFLGHLPEFVLGVAFARINDIKLNSPVLMGAAFLFLLSNLYDIFFPLSFLSVTIILIYSVQKIIPRLPHLLTRFFVFIGSISMFMFIINGPIRVSIIQIFINQYKLSPLLSSIIHFTLIIFLSYLLSVLYDKLRRKLYTKAHILI